MSVGTNSVPTAATFLERRDLDCLLVAGRYTLLDQSASPLIDRCAERGVAYLAAGVFNSGVLAGPRRVHGTTTPRCPVRVLARVNEIEQVCRAYNTSLVAAALSFPCTQPGVHSDRRRHGDARRGGQESPGVSGRCTDDLWPELDDRGLMSASAAGRTGMKIENVRAVLTGHRIHNPEMQRSWALVRIETDTGTVGWGEASTNWGHSYPTVFRAVVEDICSRHLEGRDPLAIRARVGRPQGRSRRLSRLGGSDVTDHRRHRDRSVGHPRQDPWRAGLPAPRRPRLPDPALRHGYDDVRTVLGLARALLRPVRRARVQGREGAPWASARRGRRAGANGAQPRRTRDSRSESTPIGSTTSTARSSFVSASPRSKSTSSRNRFPSTRSKGWSGSNTARRSESRSGSGSTPPGLSPNWPAATLPVFLNPMPR